MMQVIALWNGANEFSPRDFMGSVGFREQGITNVAVAVGFRALVVPAAKVAHVMECTKRGGPDRRFDELI